MYKKRWQLIGDAYYCAFLEPNLCLHKLHREEGLKKVRKCAYVIYEWPLDDLFFDVGDACQGHCTFDSGMCGFLNENTKDDFNWEVVSWL